MSRTNGHYTCMYCNKSYDLRDPGFAYFRRFEATHWAVKQGLVKEGDLKDHRDMIGELDTLGWFAHCYDREACAVRRRNVHSGVHPEQIPMEAG